MSDSQNLKDTCPFCCSYRKVQLLNQYKRDYLEHGDAWVHQTYRFFQCNVCDKPFLRIDITSRDDFRINHDQRGNGSVYHPSTTAYWPQQPKRRRPYWLFRLEYTDEVLSHLLETVYVAFDNGLNFLSAIGLRTAFDRTSELLGTDPSKSFAAKLSQLLNCGHIGASERAALDILTDAGSAAAHRGWEPSDDQLRILMSIIEQFIYRTLVLDEDAKQLKSQIPPRPAPRPSGKVVIQKVVLKRRDT